MTRIGGQTANTIGRLILLREETLSKLPHVTAGTFLTFQVREFFNSNRSSWCLRVCAIDYHNLFNAESSKDRDHP